MRFDDEPTGLHLVVKDDLRQRDVNAWSRAFREWRELNGVADLPIGRLSSNEYNCGALYGAVAAGWIIESGRRPDGDAAEGTFVDAVPDDRKLIDDMNPLVAQWYGRMIIVAYDQLMTPSPKASLPPPNGQASLEATAAAHALTS